MIVVSQNECSEDSVGMQRHVEACREYIYRESIYESYMKWYEQRVLCREKEEDRKEDSRTDSQ